MDTIKKILADKKVKTILLVIACVSAGCVNGLFGGGGGMLVVPIFTGLLALEAKKAHATAVAAILPMTVVSAAMYILRGCYEINLTLAVGSGIVAGGIIGALLLKKTGNFMLTLVFAIIMIGAGVKTLIG